MKKEQLNQHGESPTDKPGKELIKPSKKGERYVSKNTDAQRNSTGKDPNLGNRNVTR